jgi:hypothetical protein
MSRKNNPKIRKRLLDFDKQRALSCWEREGGRGGAERQRRNALAGAR